MRKNILILLFLLVAAQLGAQESVDRYVIPKKGSMTRAIKSVAPLFKEGTPESVKKAEDTLLSIFDDMQTDGTARNYGCWGWVKGGPNRDLNMPLFSAPYLFVDIWPYQDRMSSEVKEKFLDVCKAVTTAAERRFDEEQFPEGRAEIEYSNPFCMTVQTMTLAGLRFGDKRLQSKAKTLWHRLYNYYRFNALGEFMSAHYDEVDFLAILDVWKYTDDETVRKQAREVLDDMYITECAGSHPVLKLPIVGVSRDYRDFLVKSDVRCAILQEVPEGYEVPARAKKLQNSRKYPLEFEGKAGVRTHTFKSYQLEDAGMGSMTGWGNYFWQQLHCVAAAGKSAEERAVLFIPGSNNPINGFTDQKGMTSLVVYNHRPSLWHIQQGKTSDVRKTQDPFGIGISDGFEEVDNTEGHLILRAYGYDFHVFAFSVKDGGIGPYLLQKVERHTISPSHRYHDRKREFTEYLFETGAEWAGAVVKVVKAGEKVKVPVVSYKEPDNIATFTCKSEDLQLRVGRTQIGASVTVRDKDLFRMPLRTINQ